MIDIKQKRPEASLWVLLKFAITIKFYWIAAYTVFQVRGGASPSKAGRRLPRSTTMSLGIGYVKNMFKVSRRWSRTSDIGGSEARKLRNRSMSAAQSPKDRNRMMWGAFIACVEWAVVGWKSTLNHRKRIPTVVVIDLDLTSLRISVDALGVSPGDGGTGNGEGYVSILIPLAIQFFVNVPQPKPQAVGFGRQRMDGMDDSILGVPHPILANIGVIGGDADDFNGFGFHFPRGNVGGGKLFEIVRNPLKDGEIKGQFLFGFSQNLDKLTMAFGGSHLIGLVWFVRRRRQSYTKSESMRPQISWNSFEMLKETIKYFSH